MKTCKVYCTYFGIRRGDESLGPNNANETLEVFKRNIENDKVLDCGVDIMDIIIVNNTSDTVTEECINYLNSINNTATPYGKIIVINRENKGGSLGAYSYAFDLFEEEYDYWFFVEDDIRMTYAGYYKIIIDEFNDNDRLGYLSFTIIHNENTPAAWVSGGLGASKKEVLKKVKERFGKLPYDESKDIKNYGGFGQSEIIFTNSVFKIGYEIKLPTKEDIIPMGDNWAGFSPQIAWQKKKKFNFDNKKFLYHIGL